ncbi:unnamed protein product [Moneuplotes crassus]|uniref:Bardet-Biedl syndrome 1 N-terminal domain-containing protein n=1 Tax=Euplotes crassus TaxID=5936 RepID=A0AAD1X7F2_EUPCR|nr:unnamed protein product [Moneuplotes crassus]
MESSKQEESKLKDKSQIKKNPWLHAWSDPIAGVHCYSQTMLLSDLNDDGDNKLILADKDNIIKIYQGTNILFQDNLITRPIAVETFYENNKKPMMPIIAIAADDKIMLYHKYRQYYLYIFPPIAIEEEEQEIWRKMQSQEITTEQGVDQLNSQRDSGKGKPFK